MANAPVAIPIKAVREVARKTKIANTKGAVIIDIAQSRTKYDNFNRYLTMKS